METVRAAMIDAASRSVLRTIIIIIIITKQLLLTL